MILGKGILSPAELEWETIESFPAGSKQSPGEKNTGSFTASENTCEGTIIRYYLDY